MAFVTKIEEKITNIKKVLEKSGVVIKMVLFCLLLYKQTTIFDMFCSSETYTFKIDFCDLPIKQYKY